jgi:hypothetical protein
MPHAARLILGPLLLALALAGCGNAQPGNDLNEAAEMSLAIPEMNAEETRLAEERDAAFANRAVNGDVAEGEEVLFTGYGLAIGVIQLHPSQYYEFGRSKSDILAMLRNVHGQQLGEGTVRNCPGGAADYADFRNLRVYFRNSRFIGWDAAPGNPQLRDEWSVSIGMPRDDIMGLDEDNSRIFNSPRGIEFVADGLRGLLSANRPDGVIIDLWAGDTCLRD